MPVRESHNEKPGAGPDKSSGERFKAAMPRIPGVADQPVKLIPGQSVDARWSKEMPSDETDDPGRSPSARVVIMVALAVCFAGVLGWWSLHAKRVPAKAADSAERALEAPPISGDSALSSAEDAASGVTSVASLDELAKPWAAKQFTFVNPQTHEHVPAMIVRLPGTTAASKNLYWAFSLNAPYKTCQLDYLENPADLLSHYGFRASHPMVVAPCDATLYDPLRLGSTPDGAWVRGDIAQGPGIRPPISIEVRVQGGHIVADRIEQ